jgi:chromosome segregation ATPase
MNENDFEKIDGMIARHVGVFADSIQHKLDIVVEGHQMLSEKIDHVEARLDKRMDCLEYKLVAVAAETSGNTAAIRDLAVETSGNTTAIQGLTAQTNDNTIAIRDLAVETRGNTTAIQGLTAQTNDNTTAIQGLTAQTNDNTIAIRDLAVETSGNTTAIRNLTHKVDAVAADLSAHRADTEAHPPVYRVKE